MCQEVNHSASPLPSPPSMGYGAVAGYKLGDSCSPAPHNTPQHQVVGL